MVHHFEFLSGLNKINESIRGSSFFSLFLAIFYASYDQPYLYPFLLANFSPLSKIYPAIVKGPGPKASLISIFF